MLSLASQQHEEVIREMVSFIVSREPSLAGQLEDLTAAVIDRESQAGTGLGSGVAIPHARINGLPHAIAAFAKSEAGVDFDSLDQSPAHLICLLLVPTDQAALHLQALANLAKLFSSSETREKLIASNSPEEIAAILAGEAN